MACRFRASAAFGIATFGCAIGAGAGGSGLAATPRFADHLISEAVAVGDGYVRNAASLDLDVKNTLGRPTKDRASTDEFVFYDVGSPNLGNIIAGAVSRGPGEDSGNSNPDNPYGAVASRSLSVFGQQGTLEECADTSNFCGNWSGDCDTLFCPTCPLKGMCDKTCQIISLACPPALESGCFIPPDNITWCMQFSCYFDYCTPCMCNETCPAVCRLDIEPPCFACDLHFNDFADDCPDCQMTNYCFETCGTATRTTISSSATSATSSTTVSFTTSIVIWSTHSSTPITSGTTGSVAAITSATTQSTFTSVTASSTMESSVTSITSVTTSLTTQSSVASLTTPTTTQSSVLSISTSATTLLLHGKVTIVLPEGDLQVGQALPAVTETLADIAQVPTVSVVAWQAEDKGDSSYIICFNISTAHDVSEIPSAESMTAALDGTSTGDFAERLHAKLEEIGLGGYTVQVSGVEAACAAEGCGDKDEAFSTSVSAGGPDTATQEEATASTGLVIAVTATACFSLLLVVAVTLLVVHSRKHAVDMAPPRVVVAVGKDSNFNPSGTTISITTDDPEAKVVGAPFECQTPHTVASSDTVDIIGGARRSSAPARFDFGGPKRFSAGSALGRLMDGGLLTSGQQPRHHAKANLGAREVDKDASPGPSPLTSPRRGGRSSRSSSLESSPQYFAPVSWGRLSARGSMRSELPAATPRRLFRRSVREDQAHLTPRRVSAHSRVDGQDKWIDPEGYECEHL